MGIYTTFFIEYLCPGHTQWKVVRDSHVDMNNFDELDHNGLPNDISEEFYSYLDEEGYGTRVKYLMFGHFYNIEDETLNREVLGFIQYHFTRLPSDYEKRVIFESS